MANTWGIKRSDRAFLTIGSSSPVVVPIQTGAGVSFGPKYRDVEGVSNNPFDYSYFNGLYYPNFRLPVDVMNSWFTPTNLNAWFVTRSTTNDASYDDISEMPAIVYSDGNRVMSPTQPKGASFGFSVRQDDVIRAQMGVVGTGFTTPSKPTVTPPTGTRSSWADFTMISGATGVTSVSFSLDNRLRPNPIIGAGQGYGLVEMNAGRPMIYVTLTIDAAGTFPANEGSMSFSIKPPGASASVLFTMGRIRIDNPDNFEKQDERAMQTFTARAESPDGVTYPLTITAGS